MSGYRKLIGGIGKKTGVSNERAAFGECTPTELPKMSLSSPAEGRRQICFLTASGILVELQDF